MDNQNTYTDSDGTRYGPGNGRCSYGAAPLLTPDALCPDIGDTKAFGRASNRVHVSLFLYLFLVNLIVLVCSVVLLVIYAITENPVIALIMSSPIYNLGISAAAQYAIGYPLLRMLLCTLEKPKSFARKRMGAGEFFLLLLICESFMLLGSIIGSWISQLIGNLFHVEPNNALDSVIGETPVWLIVISVVVLAPIFEELIYRKLFIDRMQGLGDAYAILFSALAFALMHMNTYQLFYAFGVGLIFGYVYTRTHNVLYTIGMHMILNFLGSVATLPIAKASEKLLEMEQIVANGGEVADEAAYLMNSVIVYLYSAFQMMLMIGGLIALVVYVAMKKVKLNSVTVDRGAALRSGMLNAGFILFAAFSLIMMILNLVLMGA